MADTQPREGDLSWRLSSHPITLLTFLGFRISSLLVYILGLWFTKNFILVFVLTVVLLSFDFYYLKNIAGRRLVGLRWWNEVNPQTGDSHWVFESADPETRVQNATDRRFFWLALYAQPALWVLMGVVAIIKIISLQELTPLWITLVAIALVLTGTNTLAFSRCDRFSQASGLASSAFYGSGLARNVASGMVSRFFSR
ncbi:uncharacterized protein PV09_01491 [Verruconis gallopava]|uniref:Golgi apparatus membrane protein TVP23 n=1 Tax=Verruconis gallopava TaxID=253628 RepID=A0A0D2B8J1_9PEZI|nr:uncharacterized protein PV09_01491 [Verruconis gallopava]KIW07529.1 hypothetical protein PV09_01491 [Verruconis gallopava]